MRKKVSIIIPTHKGSKTILLAVLSSVYQSYSNIEIIVVDDNGVGTTEQIKTQELLMPLIVDNKIKYIPHQKNSNGSVARNTGFEHSKGEYIAFLDDDDYIYPSKIEKQVNLFEGLPKEYGLVFCGGYYVNEDGTGYCEIPNNNGNTLVGYMTEKVNFNTSTILIKREVFKEVKGFDESFKRHQDWEFCARVMDKYYYASLPEPLIIKYRVARNEASNPDLGAEYALHYLCKMSPLLNKMDKINRKRIINHHYRRVARSYLFSSRFSDCIRYLKKTGHPFSHLFILFIQIGQHAIRKIFNGTKERVLPIQEILKKLMLNYEKEYDIGGVEK